MTTADVIKKALPLYIEELVDTGSAFMCLVLENMILDDMVEEEAGQAAIEALEDRIDDQPTLASYLCKQGVENRKDPAVKIAFYRQWIKELEDEES